MNEIIKSNEIDSLHIKLIDSERSLMTIKKLLIKFNNNNIKCPNSLLKEMLEYKSIYSGVIQINPKIIDMYDEVNSLLDYNINSFNDNLNNKEVNSNNNIIKKIDKHIDSYIENINNDISYNSNTNTTVKIVELLQKQKDLTSIELQTEQQTHLTLTNELSNMTNTLVEATIRMRKTVQEQNIQLDTIELHAMDNMKSLEDQRRKMNERTKVLEKSFFASLWSMIMIIGLFILTYFIIRLFPKP